MDPGTGRHRLQNSLRYWRLGTHWKLLILPNGFSGTVLTCLWGKVQANFWRKEQTEGKATQDWRCIWDSMWSTWWQVTSQSCKIQHSWLWLGGCQMAMMTEYPRSTFKFHTQMWDTGRSWLISSPGKMVQMCHTLSHQCSGAPWSRMDWTNSIWDYIQLHNWRMTKSMARFRSTVTFKILSSWNLNTTHKYFRYNCWEQQQKRFPSM